MPGLQGGCLCGAVRYETDGDAMLAGSCYCTDCRRTSGTSHCTHVLVSADGFRLQGQVRFFAKPADSGHLVHRGFCPECGSALYSTNDAMPGMIFLRASSLDDPNRIDPSMTVFASRAPRWAMLDRSHPIFDGDASSGAAAVVADARGKA